MYKLLLCVRYLRTRYIALASIISVMLGVATMIVVNSVMAGFTNEMRDRIHGFLADVVIESRSPDGIDNAERHVQLVKDTVGDYIEAVSATVETPGVVSIDVNRDAFTQHVKIIGIVPPDKARVSPLKQYLGSYHETKENGKTYPPQRAADVPVGWSLTPQAAEHRIFMMELLEERLEQEGVLGNSGQTPPGPQLLEEPVFEEPVFDEPDSTELAGTEETSDPGAPIDGVADDLATFSDDPSGLLFDESLSDSTASMGTGIRKEPQEATIYIGEGIISYPVRNQETGELDKVWMARPGDDVTVTTIMAGPRPKPVSFRATISDVFRSGMSEYDGMLVLMNLEQLQQNRGMLVRDANGEIVQDAITSIQIKLTDYSHADEVVERLKAAFPPGAVSVRTWESKQGLLLSAVEMETAILNVLLFLIIAVAGFGILAIFYMIVVEKTRDIGILKSLGASSQGVMSIFLSYGLALGLVGSAAGVAIGLVFVNNINQIEQALSWATGRRVFDRDIYYFSSIPTHVSPAMVLWVAAGAMAIAVLASVLPARRASRLHPVKALRFD